MSSAADLTAPAGGSVTRLAVQSSLTQINPARLLLSLFALASVTCFGFVSLAPNRLVSGAALMFWDAADVRIVATCAACVIALLLAAFVSSRAWLDRAATFAAAMLILLVLYAAGSAAHRLMTDAAPAARVSLGAGFWLSLFFAALVLIDASQRLNTTPLLRASVVLAIGCAISSMATANVFSDLSIVREYQIHREVFAHEFFRHIVLVVAAIIAALVIGVPLGLVALSRPKLRSVLFAVLNLLQTIPSIALFGLLIAPLTWLAQTLPLLQILGVQGIGVAPALIALTGYALLPVVRNTYAGFAGADPAAMDAARALGFTRAQQLGRIALPLALPALLVGLRSALVMVIGLTVVAALIGAGGLGTFVFQGIGQYAVDLVLLGALPTIFLALAADFIFYLLIAMSGSARTRRHAMVTP